jgi:alcohol dehydrogenase
MPVPLVQLVAEERSVKGSYIGTCVPMRDVPRFIAMHRRGILPVERLVSGHLQLDDINEGLDRLHDGRAVRQIISMN